MRRAGIGVAAMVLGGLAGCAGSDGPTSDDADVQGTAESTRAAATTTFEAIGRGVQALTYSGSGTGRWVICGQLPRPSGAEYVAEVAVVQSNVAPSTYPDVVREQAEAEGWTVEDAAPDTIEGTKDGMTLRAQYGSGAMNLAVRSGCLDLSQDEITRLTEGGRDDLGLTPPTG